MTSQQRPALPSRRDIHRPHKRRRARAARPWFGATAAISTLAITTAVATSLSPAGAGVSPTPHAGPPVQPGADTAQIPAVPAGAAAGGRLSGAATEASRALARADYLSTEAYAVSAANRKQIAAAAQALRDLMTERSGATERASRAGERQPLAARTTSATSAGGEQPAVSESIEAATAQLTALLDVGERTASDVIDPGPPTPDEILADQAEAAAAAKDELAALAASTDGYSNGYIPPSVLCELTFAPAHVLRCDAAAQLERLDVAYHAYFGVHLEITDSYRSYAAQSAARASKGTLAAAPGTSNHGWGLAVDLGGGAQQFGTAQHLWLRENAPKFGWDNPEWARIGGSKPEAWHWEYAG